MATACSDARRPPPRAGARSTFDEVTALSRARYPSVNLTPDGDGPAATTGRHPRPRPKGEITSMASLQTLERRILALEARLADVEGGYGDTLYKLHRASIKADLRTAKILQRLDIEDVSDEQIDAALDEE
jgi:hypothetical protein